MSSTAARTTRVRRSAVVAVTMLAVGAAAVIAPAPVILSANAAGVAPAASRASSLAGAVTAVGASAVVTTASATTTAPRAVPVSRSVARTAIAPYRVGTKKYSKWFARTYMAKRYGWKSQRQYQCLVHMWSRESGWRHQAHNSSGAHGIPQAMPGRKMASAGPNWRTNPRTQIKWGLKYIKGRYGSPCGAWNFWLDRHWY